MPSTADPGAAALDLRLEAASGLPAFRQIAQQLAAAIAGGRVKAGTRLPPSRALAEQLGIARNSVVEAYAELAANGFLDPRGRHGTYVLPRPSREPGVAAPAPDADRPHETPRLDLGLGNVRAQALPLTVWRAACREAGRHHPPSGYGDPRGDAGLRAAIAAWLRRHRATDVDPDHLLVTPGAGQAVELIARTLVRRGDVCALEDPGYPRAARAFLAAGGRLKGVPVDEEGACIERLFSGPRRPAFVHVTPAHQYPLGGRLSGPRRRALLEGAHRHGTLVVENEYDHEFVHAGIALPPLLHGAPDRVLLIGTFAKAISPALRLGFIAAPPPIADRLAAAIARDRLQVSWPVQRMVEFLIRSGELERHLRRVRRHYARLRQAIRDRLGGVPGLGLCGDAGGLHVVLRTRPPARVARIERALASRGIAIETLARYAIERRPEPALLLGYGGLDEAGLAEVLDTVVASLARRGG